jgi:sigma-B regulation protein RsbU (phosphoserine phosphatase)
MEIKKLQEKIYQLESLVEISKVVNTKLDLPEILESFRKSATQNLNAQFCTIYLIDEEKQTIYSAAMDDPRLETIEMDIGTGVSGTCAKTGERIITNHAYSDNRFSSDIDKKIGGHTENLCTVPMKNYNGKIIGVIQLMNKPGGFTYEDAQFLEALAVPAAIAVENNYLHKMELKNKMLKRDMRMASEVQRMILPETFPSINNLCASIIYKPYYQVSGDIYNFVKFNDNTVGVAIGDVSGKGVSAALIMSTVMALFSTMSKAITSTKEMCNILNNTVVAFTKSKKFCTFFYGVIDLQNNKLFYTNAGHNPPILVKRNGGSKFLKGNDPLFGAIEGHMYEQHEEDLHEGDIIFFYTDGVTESSNHKGEMFGEERLIETTVSCINETPETLSSYIESTLKEFMDHNKDQADDYTIISIKYI